MAEKTPCHCCKHCILQPSLSYKKHLFIDPLIMKYDTQIQYAETSLVLFCTFLKRYFCLMKTQLTFLALLVVNLIAEQPLAQICGIYIVHKM